MSENLNHDICMVNLKKNEERRSTYFEFYFILVNLPMIVSSCKVLITNVSKKILNLVPMFLINLKCTNSKLILIEIDFFEYNNVPSGVGDTLYVSSLSS